MSDKLAHGVLEDILWWEVLILIVVYCHSELLPGVCSAHGTPRVALEPLVYAGCVENVSALELLTQVELLETYRAWIGVRPTTFRTVQG